MKKQMSSIGAEITIGFESSTFGVGAAIMTRIMFKLKVSSEKNTVVLGIVEKKIKVIVRAGDIS